MGDGTTVGHFSDPRPNLSRARVNLVQAPWKGGREMMKLRINPWTDDYGPSLQLDQEEASPPVQLAQEAPEAERVALVDDARRMELNQRLEDGVRSFAAAIGTVEVGVGAIVLESGQSQPLSQPLRPAEVQAFLLMDALDLAKLETLCKAEDPVMTPQNCLRSPESLVVVASRVTEEATQRELQG